MVLFIHYIHPPHAHNDIIPRWFDKCNVSIASEMKMRKRAAEIVGDNLKVEKVPLTFTSKEGGEEVKLHP